MKWDYWTLVNQPQHFIDAIYDELDRQGKEVAKKLKN